MISGSDGLFRMTCQTLGLDPAMRGKEAIGQSAHGPGERIGNVVDNRVSAGVEKKSSVQGCR